MSNQVFPRWLEVLVSEKFYNACIIHEEAKKNEKNIYCLDCCFSLCPHCLPPHRSHRLLQIRRYVYHDVIRLDDAIKLFDCAFVQSYTTNSAKVVFLNQRPQTRAFRGSGNICYTCDRSLQDPYFFCSLACKIDYVMRSEGGVGKYIYECKYLWLPEPGLEEGLVTMTPDSILEAAGSGRTSSGSGGNGGVGCRTMVSTAASAAAAAVVTVRKKRSSVSAYRAACRPVFLPASEISAAARRKGNPQRAPLY